MLKNRYYILAFDRTIGRQHLVWWKPNEWGYTTDLLDAGVYTEEQVKQIPWRFDNEETKPVPVEEARRLAHLSLLSFRFLIPAEKEMLQALGVEQAFEAFRGSWDVRM